RDVPDDQERPARDEGTEDRDDPHDVVLGRPEAASPVAGAVRGREGRHPDPHAALGDPGRTVRYPSERPRAGDDPDGEEPPVDFGADATAIDRGPPDQTPRHAGGCRAGGPV